MPAQLQAGDLDRRIVIQRATLSQGGGYNEPQETWATFLTVWAKRHDASAAEAYRAQEVDAQITTRFTIRYSTQAASITPKDRIVFDGRTYNITAVREPANTRNQWREIDAVARADQ